MTLENELLQIVQILRQRFPNLALCLPLEPIYGGYATTDLNPEPFAYEGGFAREVAHRETAQRRSCRLDFDPAPRHRQSTLDRHLSGCGGGTPAKTNGAGQPNAAGTNATADQYPTYTYEVVKVYPHDRSAFTQGLVYLKGALLESTGLNGESTLRKVDLETGNVLQSIDVPAEYVRKVWRSQDGKLFAAHLAKQQMLRLRS